MNIWRLVYYSILKYWLWSGGVFIVATSLVNNNLDLIRNSLFWSLIIFFLLPFNSFIIWIEVFFSKRTKKRLDIKIPIRHFQIWTVIGLLMLVILLASAQLYFKVLLMSLIVSFGFYGILAKYKKLNKAYPYLLGISLAFPGVIGFNLQSLNAISITFSLAFILWSIGLSLFVDSEGNAYYPIVSGVLWTTASLLLLKVTLSPLALGLSLVFPLLAILSTSKLYEHKVLTKLIEYLNYFLAIGIYLYSNLV